MWLCTHGLDHSLSELLGDCAHPQLMIALYSGLSCLALLFLRLHFVVQQDELWRTSRQRADFFAIMRFIHAFQLLWLLLLRLLLWLLVLLLTLE